MKKEVEDTPGRITSIIRLVFFIYVFILSIEIIKKATILLAPDIKGFLLEGLTPLRAIATGWFTTSIVQSSSAVGSIAAAFTASNLLTLQTAVYILIGASIGTSITALVISLITVAKKRRDFRHGFEIGLCYATYGILLGVVVLFLEYFFKIFSKLSFSTASLLQAKISFLRVPNLVELATSPITNFLFANGNKFFLLVLAFIALIFILNSLGKTVIDVLGGEQKARRFIHRHFESKYKAYLIGAVLTAIVFSSSITIGLLVPLAVARLINLKKAIPFILGARLGTSTDILLASVIIGKTSALAVSVAYFFFGLAGTLIFLPHTEFLFKITKYSSKKLMHISRKKAFYVLIAFIVIPLLLILI